MQGSNKMLLCCSAGNFPKQSNECIEESNKGHQMLMRMGWGGSGTGLGSHGQGIDTPISGGEVRDRQDQFKVKHFFWLRNWNLFSLTLSV